VLIYKFRIPYLQSGWTVQYKGQSGRVSASGRILVDAETLQLSRLEISAGDIPPDLPIASLKTSIDYAPMEIEGRTAVMPQHAESLLTELSDVVLRNNVEISHCRSFGVESKVSFDDTVVSAARGPGWQELRQLPGGLKVSIRLTTPIQSRTGKVGNPIQGVLASAVMRDGKILLPRGAVVQGRIRRLESYSDPVPHRIVGLEFDRIELEGTTFELFARLRRAQPMPGFSWFLTDAKASERSTPRGGSVYGASTTNYRTGDIPGVGTFFVAGEDFRIPAGWTTTWETMELTH
jgi:hypothetical protein